MTNERRDIAWQTYEDVIENQLDSPIGKRLAKKFSSEMMNQVYEKQYDEEESQNHEEHTIMAIPDTLASDLTLVSSFECWVGHTNFNLSKKVIKQLSKIQGVEVLKICSRYRFFIGLGRQFKFTNVRQSIQEEIIGERSESASTDSKHGTAE